MYFTSGSDRAFEQLMQTRPGADHFDSGEAGAPEDCGTCRFYRPHWKYQFCVYEECPYQPGKLTALDGAVKFQVKGVDDEMAVFRVEKNRGYTVMSNHHLRNKDLSLKAKGLLSQMLSLPEDWDFTLKGLSLINREQIDAIRAAVRELEQAGYIVRSRERDSQGRLRGADYIIYEQPQPVPDLPTLENPTLDNPTQEKPTQEKPTQLNKDRSSKDKSMTDGSNTDSIPILSPPSPLGEEAAAPPERKGTGAKSQSAVEIYREIIKDNIEYEHLCQYAKGIDRDMLDEIVDLLVETVCSARKTIRIAGDDYPAELVKSKLMKLNSSHIEFVFDCISKNTTEIRNIKKYLLAVLFNAPSTINGYYTALVAHDMNTGSWGTPAKSVILWGEEEQRNERAFHACVETSDMELVTTRKEDDPMKQGTLIFDEQTDRYDIRFDLADYYGGLHCGETFDVMVGGRWRPTRIEMAENWYLVGIHADDLSGLRVRI